MNPIDVLRLRGMGPAGAPGLRPPPPRYMPPAPPRFSREGIGTGLAPGVPNFMPWNLSPAPRGPIGPPLPPLPVAQPAIAPNDATTAIDPAQAIAEMTAQGALPPRTTTGGSPTPSGGILGALGLSGWPTEVVRATEEAVRNPSPQSIFGALGSTIPPIARPALQKPQEFVATKIGDLVYAAASGQERPDWVEGLPFGDRLYDAAVGMLAGDDEKRQKIVSAHAEGGGLEAFWGGVADTSDMGPASRFVATMALAMLTDPWTYMPILAKGGQAIETSGRLAALEKGGPAAATARDTAAIRAGQALQAPNVAVNVVGGLPFEVAGAAAQGIRNRGGRLDDLFAPSPRALRQEAEIHADDLFDTASAIPPDTTPGAVTVPPGTGATAATGAATPPGEYAVVRMGDKNFQVIDPATGTPVLGTTGKPMTFATHKVAAADAQRRTVQAQLNIRTTEPPTLTTKPVPGVEAPAEIAGPVTPTGVLKDHWMNPETGRKVPYEDMNRMPSVPEFVTYELGQVDRPMAEAWWREVEADPRTPAFVAEQAAFDRKPSPYGAGIPAGQRDSAEKILSQARHEVEVQRQAMQELLGGVPPEHVFRHGDDLHPGIAQAEQTGRGGTRYPTLSPVDRGDAERNAVERAVFGGDDEAAKARQFLHVMAATGTQGDKARATRLLEGVNDLRAKRLAQDNLLATEETVARVPPTEGAVAEPAAATGAPDTVRLYRAEVAPEHRTPQPDYIRYRQEETGMAAARSRWFARDPEEIQHYIDKEIPPGMARVVAVDVPASEAERYLVANVAAEGNVDPARYSLRPDKEYFLPPDLARQATPVDWPPSPTTGATPAEEVVPAGVADARPPVAAPATEAAAPSPAEVPPRPAAGRLGIPELPGDIAPIEDASTLGQAFNRADIGRETYADLNRQLTVGGRPMRFLDVVHQALAENPDSRADALRQVRRTVAAADGLAAADRGRMMRGIDTGLAALRENIMFNPKTVVPGAIADQIGDMLAMAVTGSPEAAVSSLNPMNAYRWWKYGRGAQRAIEHDPRVQRLNAYGVKVPRDLLEAFRSETSVSDEMVVTKGAKKVPVVGGVLSKITPLIASKMGRDLRTALDRNRRISLYATQFERQLPEARATLVGLGRKRGVDLSTLPEVFGPEEVRQTGGEDLARQWRQLVNKADAEADAAAKKTLFSYRMTNLDEKLRYAIMFHYWLSRATVLHTKAALQNPALLNAYVNAFRGLDRMGEEEGLPPPVRGLFKFMGDLGGWYAVADPLGAVLPYGIFRDAYAAGDREQERTFDKIVRRSGIFLSPLVQAAASTIGMSDVVPDVTGTWAIRGAAKTIADWDRNHFDVLHLGPGITEDWFAGVERTVFKTISDFTDEKLPVPWAKGLDEFDPAKNEQTQVLDVLKRQMEAQYGPLDTWDEGKRNEFLAAQVAIQTGAGDNDRANAALADWSSGRAAKLLPVPGGVQVRYGPRDERIALKDEGYAALDTGAEPTPAQANAMEATQQVNADDEPDAAAAVTQQDLYGKIGTEREQKIVRDWNLMAFGTPQEFVEAGYPIVVTTRGQMPVHQFVALSKEERMAEADAWLARTGVEGEYESVRNAQAAFKESNPLYKGYADFQKTMRDYPGGIPAARDALMRASEPYRTYVGRLNPDVKKTPAKFDDASVSMKAFLATRGVEGSIYDEELTGDTTAWANTEFLLNSLGGSGGGTRKQYDLDTPAGRLAQLNDRLAEYERDMKVYDAQVKQLTGGQSFDELPAFFQGGIQRQLEARGVRKPGEPGIVSSFKMWRAMQPDPSAATTASYIQWIDAMEKAGKAA